MWTCAIIPLVCASGCHRDPPPLPTQAQADALVARPANLQAGEGESAAPLIQEAGRLASAAPIVVTVPGFTDPNDPTVHEVMVDLDWLVGPDNAQLKGFDFDLNRPRGWKPPAPPPSDKP